METIRNSMDPRDNEKHEEEHEDSKKERKARRTSHYIKNHKITSLIWTHQKQSSKRTESRDEEQCMEKLWMKALWDLEPEVLSDGEDDYLFLYTRHITAWVIISPTTSMSWNSTSDKCKECSPKKLNKERMKSNLKTLRHTRKRPLYADRRR